MKIGNNSVDLTFDAPETKFFLFVLFLAVVFLMGGGSRDDIQSWIILRPIAIFLGAYAVFVSTSGEISRLGVPFWLLIGLLLLTGAQLVPLPPDIWVMLPGRETYAETADIIGIDQPWRPLSLTPSETWNTLFSLTVPIACMLLYSVQSAAYRRKIIPTLIILGLGSALLGVLQLVGPPRGPLYLYNVTNYGMSVGLFANRNHQAVFLACLIVMLFWYLGSLNVKQTSSRTKGMLAFSTALVLIPLVFVTGSRAGVVLMGIGLFVSAYFLYTSNLVGELTSKSRLFNKYLALLAFAFTIIGSAGSAIYASRSLAFDRLFLDNQGIGIRGDILPLLTDMIWEYFPVGAGFGSFEHVFKGFEPLELLRPSYMNHAHNDWLQFLIEGGIVGALLLVSFLIWYCIRTLGVIRAGSVRNGSKYRLSAVMIAFIGVASVVDYPVRVPIFMVLFCISCLILDDSKRRL